MSNLPTFLPPGPRPGARVVTASAKARVLVPGGSTPSRSVTISPCVVLGAPGSQAIPSRASTLQARSPAVPMASFIVTLINAHL